MATLVLTAVGTAIGGPIGGALGSLIGNQIDRAVFRPANREGPRLRELSVTASSYGTPIPRHFGAVRAGGTIIWATDLVESRERVGGKGQPSTTVYSYSASFAVALASRPIGGLGRIWADGNLLRGSAGDLKVGGTLRLHTGHADQVPDPLIAAAEGPACPAFRGLAYCVFESLQLGEFGNRIPALSFEILADEGGVTLVDILAPLDPPADVEMALTDLAGFSDEGGALSGTLAVIDQAYPIHCDASNGVLALRSGEGVTVPARMLPQPVVDPDGESFGGFAGQSSQRRTGNQNVPSALRYYDLARDYQIGLQRAGGQALPGTPQTIDLPGTLPADAARRLIDAAASRALAAQESLNWRIAECDPALAPGAIVTVPDMRGLWRVESWEWREHGIELDLLRLPHLPREAVETDPGRAIGASDVEATPSLLVAFELPWDGLGSPSERQVQAAVSSQSSGWGGATLYVDRNGALEPLLGTGARRAIMGTLQTPLAPGPVHLFDRSGQCEVELVASDLALNSGFIEDLAQGANRALIGSEVIQFANAVHLGGSRWRLSGLLRGRAGTEHHAAGGQPAGADFVLLDERPLRVPATALGGAVRLAVQGRGDAAAVSDPIAEQGTSLRPLSPVHPQANALADGGMAFCWTRRARGAFLWEGTVEPPLVEQAELYEVGLGNPDQPLLTWQTAVPRLDIDGPSLAALAAAHSGEPLWVRQIGSFARSLPLHLLTLS